MKAAFAVIARSAGIAFAAALFSLSAIAESAPGNQPQQPRARRDCSKAADPTACTAHREARQRMADACQGKAKQAHHQCMREQMQNIDCGKARNPGQCEARKAAYGECKGEQGPAFKRCVQQKMPPADCAGTADRQRCEQHQKARETCRDKVGPEHRNCLREILAPGRQ